MQIGAITDVYITKNDVRLFVTTQSDLLDNPHREKCKQSQQEEKGLINVYFYKER